MPDYRVPMTVIADYAQIEAQVFVQYGVVGPLASQTVSASALGDSLSFDVGPFTANGIEEFWMLLISKDSGGSPYIYRLIGPYLLSEDAVEVV